MTEFEEDAARSASAADEEEEVAMTHDGRRTRTFLAGLALGALIGAGVALLLAPGTGEETRHAVSHRARRLARDARERYDEMRDTARRARRERHEEADEAGAE
jgi:gas vesicle protein